MTGNLRALRVRRSIAALAGGVGPLLAGCASLNPRAEQQQSAAAVAAAVGAPADLLLQDEAVAGAKTAELLQGELTADKAVQVALLNNPRVRAAMASIGVSRAEFVQASLFTNPMLTLSFRLSDGGGLSNIESAFTQNIADLWLIPVRKRFAQHELNRTVLEAAGTAAGIALDTRVFYVRALRAEHQQKIAADQLAVTTRLVEVSTLRQQAGSGNEVDINLVRTQRLDAEANLQNVALAAVESRAELARLVGLSTAPQSLQLAIELPAPAVWRTQPAALEQAARSHRFDLLMADQSVPAAEAKLIEEKRRLVRSVQVGLAAERLERRTQGDRTLLAGTAFNSLQSGQLTPPNLMPRGAQGQDSIIGPSVGLELPLWDQNQAQIAKAEHQLAQTRLLRDATLIDTAQDIYSRLARAKTAADNARRYRDEQLPTAVRSAELAREAYRASRLPFLSILEAERNLLATRSAYLTSLENAALATVELERVTGQPAETLLTLSHSNGAVPASQPARRPTPMEFKR